MRPQFSPGQQPSHFPHLTAPRSDPPLICQRGCRDSCGKSCREASKQAHMVCLGVKVGPCCVPFSLLDYVSLKTDREGGGPVHAVQAKCWIQKEKRQPFYSHWMDQRMSGKPTACLVLPKDKKDPAANSPPPHSHLRECLPLAGL